MKKPIKKSKSSPSSIRYTELKGVGIAKPASLPKSAESHAEEARTVNQIAKNASDRRAFEKRMSDSEVDQMSPKKPDYAKLNEGMRIRRRNKTSSKTAFQTPNQTIAAVAPRKKTPSEIAENSSDVKYDGKRLLLSYKSRDKSASVRSRSKAAAKSEIRKGKLINRAVSKSIKEKSKAMIQGANTLQKVKSFTPEERKVYMAGPQPKVKKRDIPVTTSQLRKKRGGKF